MNPIVIIASIQDYLKNGARFVSFLYKAKESGEISRFTVLLGINIDNAYSRDLKIIDKLPVQSEAEIQAKNEIIASLKNSLANHAVGKSNDNYKLKGLYEKIGKGIKLNQDSGDLLIDAFIIKKEVIKEGEYKVVKSSLKTLAKKSLRKNLKSGKFRNFLLTPENIAGVKIAGNVLQIQPNTVLLNELSREQLRQIATDNNIPRGRDKQDTFNNLKKVSHSNVVTI